MEVSTNQYLNHAPKTLVEANQIILFQRAKIETIQQQYNALQHQILTLLRGKYGRKSERMNGECLTGDLFAGTLPIPEEKPEAKKEPEQETITYTRNKKRHTHRQIPEDLPRIRIEYQLKDEELKCPCGCGNTLHKIGEVITEQLEIVKPKIYVKQHVRFKYAGCANQEKVVTAPMPAQPIDKGLAGPGLLADVIISKYDDHLPLYRQAERFSRFGIELSRKTLCDWVMQCADLLSPIVEAMKPGLLEQPKIHTDDTPVPVQEEGKGKTKEGRLWVYLGWGGKDPPSVVYEYTPDRKQNWAHVFLEKYRGYLQADAYTGYDRLYRKGTIIEVACMAHARRKFFDVDKGDTKPGLAREALNYIGKLYQLEKRIKGREPVAKEGIRKRYAKPILKSYKQWLMTYSLRALPNSPLGKAIHYTLNQWVALTRYLGDGILDIDNGAAERLMRPVAVGRNNWTFAGSDRGGRAAATLYSLIETCKLNHVNPYDYLSDILARLPSTLMRDIKTLLPSQWKLQQEHVKKS